ncbi:MAG: hypothetical protein CMK59_02410 [Proteobacteria bacterium]|nr:hypothetical protein [Pseudomonadota bacterium]
MVWILQQIVYSQLILEASASTSESSEQQVRRCTHIQVGPDRQELSLLHKKILDLWCRKSYRKAKKLILQQKRSWKEPDFILDDPAVLLFLEGLVWGELGKEKRQLEVWRQALLWNPQLIWPQEWFVDPKKLKERQTDQDLKYEAWWDLFLAVKSEFQAQSSIDPLWPKKASNVEIYANGLKVFPEGVLFKGSHWVQVQCPEESLISLELDFPLEESIDWLSLCTKGVVFYQQKEDDWDVLETSANTLNYDLPSSNSSNKKTAQIQEKQIGDSLSPMQQVEEGFVLDEAILRSDTSLIEPYVQKYPMSDQVKVVTVDNRIDWLPIQVSMLIGGSALMAAGGSWTLGMVRPLYMEILNVDPAEITRQEADQLTEKFSKAQMQAKIMLYSGAFVCAGGAGLAFLSVHPNQLTVRFQF